MNKKFFFLICSLIMNLSINAIPNTVKRLAIAASPVAIPVMFTTISAIEQKALVKKGRDEERWHLKHITTCYLSGVSEGMKLNSSWLNPECYIPCAAASNAGVINGSAVYVTTLLALLKKFPK